MGSLGGAGRILQRLPQKPGPWGMNDSGKCSGDGRVGTGAEGRVGTTNDLGEVGGPGRGSRPPQALPSPIDC